MLSADQQDTLLDDESSSYESDDTEEENTSEIVEINDERKFKEEDPLSFFIDVLEDFLIVQYHQEQVNAAKDCLINWIMMSTDDLGITPFIQSGAIKIWTLQRTKAKWAILAEFALKCFAIVGSEAGVERIFSQHKHVVDHLRRKTSSELRIARLNMKV